MVALLKNEEDFSATKPLLQERLEALGCRVVYGVKFHPEFMMVKSCYRLVNLYSEIDRGINRQTFTAPFQLFKLNFSHLSSNFFFCDRDTDH